MAQDKSIEKILNTLINNSELEKYYHVDVRPERKPLIIALKGVKVGDGISLNKFNVPVEIREGDAKGAGVLTVNFVKSGKDTTEIEFTYAAEGLRGRATFETAGDKVVLRKFSIIEG
ncbi:hypothetical protein [Bosea sp. (in: a-proteobacteria)]|uniref:hypothetical protein n=1 Tax=Bosea sp. (in: a-proteobacteria) TaxID=1871050 RepID=UPI002DDDBC75|nr:hypothetical protein [Bosea sp. (in: a-proteobacteria)]HEV2511628.1 hypothetical protein [Bosea sp. (in: a-proteobacteria)]